MARHCALGFVARQQPGSSEERKTLVNDCCGLRRAESELTRQHKLQQMLTVNISADL